MAEREDVFSDSWRALSASDKTALVRKALHAQSRLDTAIRTLSDYRKAEASATARQSIDGVRDFFSAFLASKFYPEQHAPGATRRPHRIWQATSLIERMLSFVGVADLFTLRQVNRTLRNQIDTAEILQYQTCRSTDLDGHFKTAFTAGSQCSKLTGVTVEALFSCNTAMLGIEKPPGHFAAVLEVRFDAKHSKTPVPNRYYPYGAMFLSQPPPTEIDVFPDCCSRGTYSSTYASHQQDPLNAAMALGRLQPVGKVVSNSGLTVGHLYDAIERIREEHRICPHAVEISNHDDDGNYWPNISFGCLLKVRADDPVLNPRVAAGVMSRTPPPAPNWRMWDYVDAKQKAYAAGRRIPTLAEFEASMRLDSFRAALPEEPRSSDPTRMDIDYRIQMGMQKQLSPLSTGDGLDGFRPPISQGADWHSFSQTSTLQRRDSNIIISPRPPSSQRHDNNIAPRPPMIHKRGSSNDARPPTSGRADGPQEHVFALTPKKNAALHQHRRDDSKLEPERPSTSKRKKV